MRPAPKLPALPKGEPRLAIAILADQMELFGLGWRGKRLRDASPDMVRFRVTECTGALVDAAETAHAIGATPWFYAAHEHCKAMHDALDELCPLPKAAS